MNNQKDRNQENQMREINPDYVKQVPSEPDRRWFEDDFFDLLIWENEVGEIVEFQLCYDKRHDQHALTWKKQSGYMHNKVDDGENNPGKYKASAMLIPDGIFDFETIAEKFKRNSKDMDSNVSLFVYGKIKEFSNI